MKKDSISTRGTFQLFASHNDSSTRMLIHVIGIRERRWNEDTGPGDRNMWKRKDRMRTGLNEKGSDLYARCVPTLRQPQRQFDENANSRFWNKIEAME
jgi:hypothetical protein